MSRIYLIGMMSSGKSTVGKLLAEKMGYGFFDTDEFIERKTGRKVKDIIEEDGLDFFAAQEFLALVSSPLFDCVISTGGKTYIDSKCRDFINSNGKVVFLNTTLEEIVKRLTPAELERRTIKLQGETLVEALAKIREDRLSIYRSGAVIEIDATGTPQEVCDRVLKNV